MVTHYPPAIPVVSVKHAFPVKFGRRSDPLRRQSTSHRRPPSPSTDHSLAKREHAEPLARAEEKQQRCRVRAGWSSLSLSCSPSPPNRLDGSCSHGRLHQLSGAEIAAPVNAAASSRRARAALTSHTTDQWTRQHLPSPSALRDLVVIVATMGHMQSSAAGLAGQWRGVFGAGAGPGFGGWIFKIDYGTKPFF